MSERDHKNEPFKIIKQATKRRPVQIDQKMMDMKDKVDEFFKGLGRDDKPTSILESMMKGDPRLDPDYPEPVITRPHYDEWQDPHLTVEEVIALSLNIDPVMVYEFPGVPPDELDTIYHPKLGEILSEFECRIYKLMRSELKPRSPQTLVNKEEAINWMLKQRWTLPGELMTPELFKARVNDIVKGGGLDSIAHNKVAWLYLKWKGEGVEGEEQYIVSGKIGDFIDRVKEEAGGALGDLFNQDSDIIRRDLTHKPRRRPDKFKRWAEHHKPIRFDRK